jgi:(1->4)-alpha-D-glucan 1-alpha-D-glucosylmutase
MPGVPDVYQGSELWEQSLVDPDNRRPVDYDEREQLLQVVCSGGRQDNHLSTQPTSKLWVTRQALRLRRDRPELFTNYMALAAEGPAAEHALAFDRGGAVTVVTRLPVGLARRGGWGDTVLRLPEGEYAEQLTGRRFSGGVDLAELLDPLPVALLAQER